MIENQFKDKEKLGSGCALNKYCAFKNISHPCLARACLRATLKSWKAHSAEKTRIIQTFKSCCNNPNIEQRGHGMSTK